MSAVIEAREPSAKSLNALQPKLVDHFELLSAASGGVAKLRELVLTLAVQGKLVPQDPSEKSASDLLDQIRVERSIQVAEGKLRQEKKSGWLEEVTLPCTLPKKWAWVSLSQLGEFRGGKTPSTQNPAFWGGEIPWITPKDMKQLNLSDSEDHVTRRAVDDGLALVPRQSVLVVVRSGILRRSVPTAVNQVDTTINQDLKALVLVRPELATYVQLMVRGFERFILKNLTKVGTTVESMQFDAFAAQPLPLPPLAEQYRIVTRVEELMRLCDSLEAKGQLEAVQHAQLVQTLLGALTASDTQDELADNWQRVATHFDLLLDRPEAIDALEKTILLLAMRGSVTEQLPSDGKAGDILLNPPDLPEGTKRRRKILRRMRDTGIENDLTDVPPSWEWISIQDLYELNVIVDYGDGNHGSLYPRSDEFGPNGVTFVSAKDIVGGCITWETCSKLNEQRAAQLNKGWAKGGDVLLTHNATVGRVALVEGDADPFLLGTSVTFYRTNACALAPSYLFFFFMSPVWQNQLKGVMEQTTRNQVSIQKQAELLVPLPPLAEQLRIVARIESLRRLCADLRQRLATRQTIQAHLAEALIDEVA